MPIYRNFDKATEYLNPETRDIEVSSITREINGWFKKVNSKIIALSVEGNRLFFTADTFKILVTVKHHVRLKSLGNSLILLELCDEGEVIAKFIYEEEDNYSGVPPFEYLDDEDWGAFVAEVINDKTRRRNFIKDLSSASSSVIIE
jgi:hypothetical protein